MNIAPSCLAGMSAILLSAFPAFAEERTFDLPEFDRIDVSAGVKVVANVGGKQSIKVETKHGDFSDFEIEVRNGELSVTREWNRLRWHGTKGDYKVILSVKNLKGLDASSGSHTKISNVDAQRFAIDLSSGAHAEINGVCDACTLELSSGSNLEGEDLVCETARIDVSSGGHGMLTVNQSVVADASSGGHVLVYGNPTVIDIDKSSGGRIKIKPLMAQASAD